MKKNLQFVLALTLGLATTVSAQDWSVSSNTRVNNMDVSGVTTMDTEQMTRMGVSFGTDAVSANATFNADYNLGGGDATFGVHTATATTNLMSFASVTAGRMALNFGSGRIMGSNDWNNDGNTWDGFMFGINNDFADLHVGYASRSEEGGMTDFEGTTMMFNVSKDMGNMGFNLLYTSTERTGMAAMTAPAEETAMGLDATYAMDNGAVLSLGYYTADDGAHEMDLTALGVSYAVNDDLSVHAGYDMYGEHGFYLASGSFGDMLGSGMEYSTFEDFEGTDMSFGGSYSMGDFMIGATMHTVESEDELTEYSVTDLSLGYSLSENSSVSMNYSTTDRADQDWTATWLSLNIGF